MEFGLREWLIVIGIIVIAGILFDGWRRMRGGKGKLIIHYTDLDTLDGVLEKLRTRQG